MADDQDYPANADVIQGGRSIRRNPALLAALASPPITDDPSTVDAPETSPDLSKIFSDQIDRRRAYVQKLANAAARVASPTRSPADDATLTGLIQQGGSPLATPSAASLPPNAPTTPPQGSAIANPPPVGSAATPFPWTRRSSPAAQSRTRHRPHRLRRFKLRGKCYPRAPSPLSLHPDRAKASQRPFLRLLATSRYIKLRWMPRTDASQLRLPLRGHPTTR